MIARAHAELAALLARSLAGGPAAALEAAARALAARRSMDPAGAAAALGADREFGGLLSRRPTDPDALARRLLEMAGVAACLRCGTCCRVSSPTLYAEDAALLGLAGPGRRHFYTLRTGELARNHRTGRVEPLAGELIKVREAPGAGCVLLAAAGCAVHGRHPLQCRHLECWSGRHAGRLAERPRLTRAMVYAGWDTVTALIEEYEARLPAAVLAEALAGARAGRRDALDLVLETASLDARLRAGAVERYGLPAEELPLIWGRPAAELARAHGLALGPDQGGNPRIRPEWA